MRVNFNYFISEAVFDFVVEAVDLVAREGWRLDNATAAPNVQFWEYESTDLESATLEVSGRLRDSRQLDDAAAARYGVPANVVVAIWGAESNYGGNYGNIPTIDALATLAFDYPPRSAYFRAELEQFLLYAYEVAESLLHRQGSAAQREERCRFVERLMQQSLQG